VGVGVRGVTGGAGAIVALALAASLVAAACGGPAAPPQVESAERAWDDLQREPTSANWKSFRAANLEAARVHRESHDRLGVQFQVRAMEAQAGEVHRVGDEVEASRLAWEVVDAVNDIEAKDLLRVYDDVLPGAANRLRAARERARARAK
jgi:hypothetical protein